VKERETREGNERSTGSVFARSSFSLLTTLRDHRLFMYAVLAALLYLPGLGRPPLWEPDEGRYAEIAREMVVDHDYVTPRNNFVRYFEKPPLVYWLTGASLKIFGRNEFAVRFQGAIASIGQVVISGALAEGMFGATAGMFAALALALSPLFFVFARSATPDPALAFFITAAMACFYQSARSSGLPIGIDSKWMVAAAAMLAFGTLTKGPVALVLGGAIALFWLILEGRGRDVLQIPWLKCLALYLALTLPWFILVALRNPGFLHFFIFHEHFERYLASSEHGWGPWFYVPITIAGTWPWFYFTPLALTISAFPFLSPRGSGVGNPATRLSGIDSEPARERAAVHFLLIWFAVILIFFSIPRSKLGEYILPGLPPIAILAGRGLAWTEKLPFKQRRRMLLSFAVFNVAAAITIVSAILVAAQGKLGHALAGDAMIAAGALLVGGIAPIFGRYRPSVITLALALSMVAAMGVGIDARQRVAPWVSYRRLAGLIVPYTNQGCRLMSYRHFEQALPFYTGARETLVNYRGELEPFGPRQDLNGDVFATDPQLKKAWDGVQCLVLVANRLDLPTLVKQLYPVPTIIGREGKKLALYNRPLDARAPTREKRLSAATNRP
jgi:4-amino-4-deoxy-L-arabinose transferase-like glycosyltransferase